MSVAQVFERLHRKAPTDTDLRRIYEIGAAVGAEQDDTFLSLIVALDYYHGLYSTAPEQIKRAVSASTDVTLEAARVRMQTTAQETMLELSKAVQDAAKAAARGASVKAAAQWICGGLAVCGLVLALMAKTIHDTSYESGFALGKAEQRNEELYIQEKDAWARTPEGKQAYALHENGALQSIINCDKPGWQKSKDGMCFPLPAPDQNVYGWKLP